MAKKKNSNNNSVIEEFQPEMLSSDETVSLMLEILRRVAHSTEMVR